MFVTKVVLLYQIIIERFWKCFREGSWCYLELWIDIIQTNYVALFYNNMTIHDIHCTTKHVNSTDKFGIMERPPVCIYMKSFSNKTLNFFFRKFCFSYIFDRAKTVWAQRILSQKFTRNFVIEELENPWRTMYFWMLLCSSHFTEVH